MPPDSVSVSVNSGVPVAVRVVVEVEGDGAGRVVPAADRGLVGDRAADGGAGRLLAGVDRRAGRVDRHQLNVVSAADSGKRLIEDKRIGLWTNIKVNQRARSATARIEAALQFSRSRSRKFKNRRSIRRCFHIRYKTDALVIKG